MGTKMDGVSEIQHNRRAVEWCNAHDFGFPVTLGLDAREFPRSSQWFGSWDNSNGKGGAPFPIKSPEATAPHHAPSNGPSNIKFSRIDACSGVSDVLGRLRGGWEMASLSS